MTYDISFFRLWGSIGLWLLWLSGGSLPALAQGQQANWVFGFRTGLHFASDGTPPQGFGTAIESKEACAVASDSAGHLLAYSDGVQVWDRTHTPMPNGTLSNSYSKQSATQGALLLPRPGQQQQWYLFTVDAVEHGLVDGLAYSLLDFNRRAGLGDVAVSQKNVRLSPPGQRLTEKLTAVRHANGRDYWVLVHAWQSNQFYSYLLTAAGPRPAPVVSAVGLWHRGGTRNAAVVNDSLGNAAGYLRASPDGRRLACALVDSALEMFDFDNATGRVSNAQRLSVTSPAYYGLEFSADGSKLYLSPAGGNYLYQIDMAAGNATTPLVAGPYKPVGGLLRGPDGRIYFAEEGLASLGIITSPNRAGPACGVQHRAVPLGAPLPQRFSILGLPGFATEPDPHYLRLTGPDQHCAQDTLRCTAALVPAAPGARVSWNFGDPAAGTANVASGAIGAHAYAQPGTYTVTATVELPDGRRYGAAQLVVINYQPRADLGPRVQGLCPGQPLRLGPATEVPGVSYRWHDGLTGATRLISSPGRYRLTLSTAQGCLARDSVTVVAATTPTLVSAPDSAVCPDGFPVLLRPQVQPAGSTIRWPDGSTGPQWLAAGPGNYLLQLHSPLGCPATVTYRLSAVDCPQFLPNIITPNGDPLNQRFVLQGLTAADWNIRIYNRWGREIYRREQYDNSWAAEGHAAGVYYYLLTNARTGQRHKGWVEVVR